jgi:hypothetical protein
MTWIVESPAQSGYVFVFSPVAAGGNNQPIVTPPNDITLQFANGGAGLSKSNAQLLAWIATASATDIEDGALAVTADLSSLADPIPAGTYTITFTSAQDTSGLTGSATAQLTVQEAVAVNDPPASSGNYAQQSATVGVPFSFDARVNFSDPGDVLTFSLATPVTGISIDGATGVVTTTFADAGGLTLEIMATDSVGQTATALLPIVVTQAQAGADLSPLSGRSDIAGLYVGDVGRLVRLDADFDLSGFTELYVVFVDPNGTRIEKSTADGVRLGSVDVSDPTLGTLERFTYVEYENESDLFLLPGKWMMQLIYADANATPPDRYHGAVVVFKVNNRPDLQ